MGASGLAGKLGADRYRVGRLVLPSASWLPDGLPRPNTSGLCYQVEYVTVLGASLKTGRRPIPRRDSAIRLNMPDPTRGAWRNSTKPGNPTSCPKGAGAGYAVKSEREWRSIADQGTRRHSARTFHKHYRTARTWPGVLAPPPTASTQTYRNCLPAGTPA